MKRILLSIIAIIGLGLLTTDAQCLYGNCYEGNGEYRFENGDRYKGKWEEGMPNGYGRYYFKNGDEYRGNWLDGMMDGRGTYDFRNGDKYIGMWMENKMHGRGHYIWNLPGDAMTDAKYEGYWENGVIADPEIQVTQVPQEKEKE